MLQDTSYKYHDKTAYQPLLRSETTDMSDDDGDFEDEHEFRDDSDDTELEIDVQSTTSCASMPLDSEDKEMICEIDSDSNDSDSNNVPELPVKNAEAELSEYATPLITEGYSPVMARPPCERMDLTSLRVLQMYASYRIRGWP
jgi:hypothetical protein